MMNLWDYYSNGIPYTGWNNLSFPPEKNKVNYDDYCARMYHLINEYLIPAIVSPDMQVQPHLHILFDRPKDAQYIWQCKMTYFARKNLFEIGYDNIHDNLVFIEPIDSFGYYSPGKPFSILDIIDIYFHNDCIPVPMMWNTD
jgi:hypothetical protein